MNENGTLYLVSTPIGNLEDITLRALRVLREADIIAAEDTRHTLKLLNHFEIKNTLISYHEHNRIEKGRYLVSLMLDGKSIALVSDAGTPGISDPGEDLVKLAITNGIQVTAIPGPVAAITGLIMSGLPTGRFVFEGFLPMSKRDRKDRISVLGIEVRTIILYEAPHKLLYTLKDLFEALGDRKIVLARELTKKFEQTLHCTLKEAVEIYSQNPPKGEFVIILEGIEQTQIEEDNKRKWEEISLEQHVDLYVQKGKNRKEAMKQVADDRGISKRDVYNSLLEK